MQDFFFLILFFVTCEALILFLKITISISSLVGRETLSREGEKFKHTPQ